jgi:hypothetical protein
VTLCNDRYDALSSKDTLVVLSYCLLRPAKKTETAYSKTSHWERNAQPCTSESNALTHMNRSAVSFPVRRSVLLHHLLVLVLFDIGIFLCPHSS